MVADAIPEAARRKPLEPWWQEEARVGQKGSLTSVWMEKGRRPRAPRDQCYEWAYPFGAVCPVRGFGAGLVLPAVNTQARNLHLAEISCHAAPGTHAVVVRDGAGWHCEGGALVLPHDISLLSLPPYSPELNPVEKIWQFHRLNKLANRVYENFEDIIQACWVLGTR